MSRLVVLLAAVAASSAGACSRGAKPNGGDDAGPIAAASAGVTSAGAPTGAPSGAIFSAPIAAAHVDAGAVVVAGLVVATNSITALRIESDGRIAWTHELIPKVAWSSDAELKAYPLAGGVAVVWRGLRDGKNARVLVPIAGDGRSLDAPIDVGTVACSTDDGAAWSETVAGGKARVRLRTWGSPGSASHDEAGPAVDDDFTIACGAHRAYAVSEGSDESPPRAQVVPAAPGFPRTLGADVFGHDEERDLLPFTDGDDLGIVRVSAAGEVQVADTQQGKSVLLRRDKNKIPVDDDIVAVDADDHAVYVVYTHDESDGCKDNRGGASIRALRIARQSAPDGALLVAPAECGKDAGPFWTGLAGSALVVAWAERAPRSDKTSAPIAALAYRVMDGKAKLVRVAQPADALVDAGCVAGHCYAVALAREPGSDGMRPESARVLVYP